MATNSFNKLIGAIEAAFKSEALNKGIKKAVSPKADAYRSFIIGWLEGKSYPLRRGALLEYDTNRVDKYYGQTPTERLWHGMTLASAQEKPKFVALRKVAGTRVRFDNAAPHAKYFFPEIAPHVISAKDEDHPLVFNWGDDLPWFPLDRDKKGRPGKPGRRKRLIVNHPGHMDYSELLADSFDAEFSEPFSRFITAGAKAAVVTTLRSILK